MNFKNGFKVGMAIASPIVLMSTYAAPCFAAGTSVFITKLDTNSENIDISSLSMQEGDKIVYGADLSSTTDELSDITHYTITGSNLKLTKDGLKKIYGAESITKGLEVKLGLKPTSGDTKLICTIVFPAKEVEVTDLNSTTIKLIFDGKTIDSANDFSVTFGNSNTPLDGRTDYEFVESATPYTGIKFTAAGLQKIYEGISITADKDVTVKLINTTSSKDFNLTKTLKFKMTAPAATYTADFKANAPDDKTADDVQNMPSPQTNIAKDGKITKPAKDPTLDGYEFAGWYEDSNCSDNKKWGFDSKVTKNITLYAKWIQIPVLEVSEFDQKDSILKFIESYEYEDGDKFKFGDVELKIGDEIEGLVKDTTSGTIVGIKFSEAGLKKIYGNKDAEAIENSKVVDIKAVGNNTVEKTIGKVSFKATDTTDTDKDDDNNSTGSSSSDSKDNSEGSSSNAGSGSSKTSGTKRGSGTRTGEAFMGLQGLAAMISAGLGLFISKRRKK